MQVDISGITSLTRDRDASIRLYRSYKKRHPKQSPQWVVQKVMLDLQRDKGAPLKTQHVRTRSGNLRNNKKASYDWFCGIQFVGGSWTAQNRGWVFLGFICLLVFLSSLRYSTDSAPGQHYQAARTLAAPGLRQQIENGAVLTIQNEVPEPVEVILKGQENKAVYTFTLPAYSDGRYYLDQASLPEGCSENAPSYSLSIRPGLYEATMVYMGTTRTESGTWNMLDQWEQFGCYYSIYNENDQT